MFRAILAVSALISVACAYYLIMTPMERNEFFLTHELGKKLFPRLDNDQRQQRLVFYAGITLATILSAATIYFLVKYLSRR